MRKNITSVLVLEMTGRTLKWWKIGRSDPHFKAAISYFFQCYSLSSVIFIFMFVLRSLTISLSFYTTPVSSLVAVGVAAECPVLWDPLTQRTHWNLE